MFNPPWWAIFLNPHFLPRRALASAMRNSAGHLQGKVLDVGCGMQPYRALLTGATSVTGLELDTAENRAGKQADVFYSGTTLPFESASFDSVLCNQVLEHVPSPEAFLAELIRVLRPDGILVLSVPFIWPEHEQPNDSQRFTSFGLAARLDRVGFEVIQQTKLVGGGGVVMALLADRINGQLSHFPAFVRIGLRAVLICPISVLGILLSAFASKDPSLFLDNFVTARKR
jgi:SAM-dependent methyltransferase